MGKHKAFNATYDDGVLQDVQLVALMNRYGIRGTFNLNSGLMESEFEWVHENGMTVKRLSRTAVQELYHGHEIASHTLTHPYMQDLSPEQLILQMRLDKMNLESLFGREVKGFAVPFDYYSDLIAKNAKEAGFTYARMSEFSLSYFPWQERYHWKCGVFHLQPELTSFVDGFLKTEEELALCQIVGHSYDLDAEDLWDTTEDIFRKVSLQEDVWLATNIEIVEYLCAMNCLEISDNTAVNRSNRDLWIEADGKAILIRPGESYKEEMI